MIEYATWYEINIISSLITIFKLFHKRMQYTAFSMGLPAYLAV